MKAKALITLWILFFSASCFSNTTTAPMNPKDPYENFNRAIFKFNMGFNDYIGIPISNAYNSVVPSPIRTGFQNFYYNLEEPLNMLNSFLQGKPEEGLRTFMRFSVNSVFGLAGFIDVATPARLVRKKEDLGQTLYQWGVWNEASYIMVPFLGPHTTRSLVGRIADGNFDPSYKYIINANSNDELGIYVFGLFVDYAKYVDYVDEVKKQPDPYIFMRETYLQYRTNLIYDGNPPQPKLDDFNFE